MQGAWIVGGVTVVLIGLRWALPFVVKTWANRQLAKHPTYGGAIGDLSFILWRGECQVRDISIFKKKERTKSPFFTAAEANLSIYWKELFRRTLVGDVVLFRPKLHLISDSAPGAAKTGGSMPSGEILKGVFPFRLNRLEIYKGQIHFENERSSPRVHLSVSNLRVIATNFTNLGSVQEELPACVKASGGTMGGGQLKLQLRLDPLAPAPTFELACEVTNVDLVALNNFLKAYGKFDVERGTFALFTSIASKNGSYEGFVKVVLENLDVFSWQKERKKSLLGIFWQAVLGTLTTVFKNQSKDRLATEIPVSGSFKNTEVNVWSAVLTLLQNAFIRALLPKVGRQMRVEEVDQPKKSPKARPYVGTESSE